MKKAIILLILVSFCFGTFGESQILLERTWTIQGSGNYSFSGALAMNDSNQQVVSINTTPEMQIQEENGNIRVLYIGNESVLKASALIIVDYDTNLTQDQKLETQDPKPITGNLTAYNPDITSASRNLSSDSTLHTILNLTRFVHSRIHYNESYFGQILPATEAFVQREGVCSEYSHLLIAMADSIGLEAVYVSGYANGGQWQPHAWVEVQVPGYGTLPVDPTFNQIGILDSSHIAVARGEDQSAIYDTLESSHNLTMSNSDNVSIINQSADPKGLFISHSFSDPNLSIYLMNSRQEYVFSSFGIALPEEFGIKEERAVLLGPGENLTADYSLDTGSLETGYLHAIPVNAYLGDSYLNATLQVEKEAEAPWKDERTPPCAPLLLILILVNLYISLQY